MAFAEFERFLANLMTSPADANDGAAPAAPTTDARQSTSKQLYFLFFLLGNGMLFPWNTFITCTAYHQWRYQGSQYYASFAQWTAVGFMVMNWLLLLWQLRGGSGANDSSASTTIRRIQWSWLVNVGIFTVCAALTRAPSIPADLFFAMQMTMVVACGVCQAFLQGGLFSVVAVFPAEYMTAVMSGQGLAGAWVAAAQMVSLVIGQRTANGDVGAGSDASGSAVANAALVYFGVSVAVMIGCWYSVVVLQRHPIYRQQCGGGSDQQAQSSLDDEETMYSPVAGASSSSAASTENVDDMDCGGEDDNAYTVSQWSLLRKIWPLLVSVFSIYFVTLALFPGLMDKILSITNPENIYFVPGAFMMFALGDWLGKAMPSLLPAITTTASMSIWSESLVIMACSFARLVFIPLFLMSNITGRPNAGGTPPLIASDVGYYVVVLAFAVSNGFLGSVAMRLTSDLIAERQAYYQPLGGHQQDKQELLLSKEKELGGKWMVFALTTGLMAGSFTSFGVMAAL